MLYIIFGLFLSMGFIVFMGRDSDINNSWIAGFKALGITLFILFISALLTYGFITLMNPYV